MNNPDQVERLAVLQVLGQKHRTLTGLRRGHDEGVPPRQGVAFLQNPGSFHDGEIHFDWLSRRQRLDDLTDLRPVEVQSLAREGRIEFLQDLKTQTPRATVRKQPDPLLSTRLLRWNRIVVAVNEDVGVNEDGADHTIRRVSASGRQAN